MSHWPSTDDLLLVVAIDRHGSIGAAARELLVAQPSASARLAALERRLGVRLFDRDTTGARATDAGRAFVREATHVLSHLAMLPQRVHAGAGAPLLRAATFPSLAAALFPALAERGEPVGVHQHVDHGDALVRLVAEGALDMAVIAIAAQVSLPASVTGTALGTDELVAFVPAGVEPPGRRLSGPVLQHSVDLAGPAVERRVIAAGGEPRPCATGEVAMAMARATARPALLARCLAEPHLRAGERVAPAPVAQRFGFQVVTRTPVPGVVGRVAPALARRLGLAPPDRSQSSWPSAAQVLGPM